ncbi:MAG: glycosyltransferase family 39 protein [Acidobacteriaceae bacterium]|nr:glycosyltransferase family 39 protein [Acidobacteriaceae bacterium]
MSSLPKRSRSTTLAFVLVWVVVYASFALWWPALLDDADSVHSEVAREMLLRHDWVTLYANGIRYLEKAPLMYWLMAVAMKVAGLLGATSPRAMAAAARVPIAASALGLAFAVEAFARRVYASARAGLNAGLIVLSSAGVFLFTRITLPDAFVCLWMALAMYALLRMEESDDARWFDGVLFGVACALGVLSKGLIGLVFPAAVAALYLLLAYGWRGGWRRLGALPWGVALVSLLVVAAPWHVLAGMANPTVGQPTPFRFVNGHWKVPLPTDGNVRGWYWFYFMNEHVLRYLNLRVPHDYDTSPLWLFWGLCFVWIMPWSAFVFKAVGAALPVRTAAWRARFQARQLSLSERGQMLAVVWAAVVLGFFTLSTRQEYYVLPALPALAVMIAGWLAVESEARRRSAVRCVAVVAVLGGLFAMGSVYFLLHTRRPAPNTDLASLLATNPGDYALSMGHFLDLNAQALGLFRVPLALAAVSLFGGPLLALLWLRRSRVPAAVLALTVGACGFLVAAHLGLQTFAPVLSSAQLAEQIAPQVHAGDLVMIHGEYEAGSTLGFYLRRNDVHILEGRSSNLWYGSFFPDAPKIFETPASVAAKWSGSQRILMWQSLTDPPNHLPVVTGPVYVVARGGGKEIVSNQP